MAVLPIFQMISMCTQNVERSDPSWVQTGRCEDAFFFSSKAAGVADGVGQMEQFSEYGVDAAKQLSPKKIACTC